MSRPSKERIEDIKNEVDFILSTVSSKDKCYECAKMMHDLLAEISALTAERDLAFKAEDAKADYARELIKKRDTLREQVRGLTEALKNIAVDRHEVLHCNCLNCSILEAALMRLDALLLRNS